MTTTCCAAAAVAPNLAHGSVDTDINFSIVRRQTTTGCCCRRASCLPGAGAGLPYTGFMSMLLAAEAPICAKHVSRYISQNCVSGKGWRASSHTDERSFIVSRAAACDAVCSCDENKKKLQNLLLARHAFHSVRLAGWPCVLRCFIAAPAATYADAENWDTREGAGCRHKEVQRVWQAAREMYECLESESSIKQVAAPLLATGTPNHAAAGRGTVAIAFGCIATRSTALVSRGVRVGRVASSTHVASSLAHTCCARVSVALQSYIRVRAVSRMVHTRFV